MKTDAMTLPDAIVREIESYRDRPHSESYLIAVLQKIQTQFGYLPRALMDEVSQRMQIPAAKVTGVATFYHFFSFTPRGKHVVTVCMGTACFVRGADKVLARLKERLGVEEGGTTEDQRFTLSTARCIGTCALAPVVLVDDTVYGNVTPAQVDTILATYGYQPKGAQA
jgi:NADH:ubiquinone oxidoreductase subunit E